MIEASLVGPAAVISLADPRVHNAMGEAWPAEFERALEMSVALRPELIVVRGRGPSFCSGVNTRHFAAGRLGPDWFRAADRALLCLDQVPVPTVAAIHGYCLGGGLQIATACDIRIITAGATLGLPAQAEGLIPGMSFVRLSRLIGFSWAADLILSGQLLSASDALTIGLATRQAADDELDAEITRLSTEITQADASVTALSKQLLAAARLDQYQQFEQRLHAAMQRIVPAASAQ
jgi:enoyl-CoA hydratase/carnithine racemase